MGERSVIGLGVLRRFDRATCRQVGSLRGRAITSWAYAQAVPGPKRFHRARSPCFAISVMMLLRAFAHASMTSLPSAVRNVRIMARKADLGGGTGQGVGAAGLKRAKSHPTGMQTEDRSPSAPLMTKRFRSYAAAGLLRWGLPWRTASNSLDYAITK